MKWGTGNRQGFHLDCIGGGDTTTLYRFLGALLDSSSMFVFVHVGATSDLCVRDGGKKTAFNEMAKGQFFFYTTIITLSVGKYGFCV